MKKQLQDKIRLCESYQAILLKLLTLSLGKFGRKLLTEELKFIFTICTVAYFKIPEFKEQLLNVVINEKDEPRAYCFEKCFNKESFEKLLDW